MRAVQYSRPEQPPQVLTLPDPVAPAGGVVLRVTATGVCRSDWHAWMGHEEVPLPHVPGHELAGVIVETGSGVERFSVGQRVTVPFVCGCGRCEYCLAGQAQVCPDQTQPGFSDPGSFAELVAIRNADHNLVELPPTLDDVSAAALGCRFATSYRALTGHARVQPGQWVAVHGCGGVGLSAVLIAAELGARVIAVDVSPAALQAAGRLGAEVCLDVSGATPEQVAERVREASGQGAHVSIDALGSVPTATAALLGLRRRGRHVQVGLLIGPDSPAALPMDVVVSRELEVYGSHGMAAVDYPAMLDLICRPAVANRVRSLVTSRLRLDEAPAALMALGRPAPDAGIAVIDLSLG